MIDGFRYGFFASSDVPPALSLGIVAVALAAVAMVCLLLLKSGYKLRT
jgi:ABC-2 type transport system permease protein